MCTDIEPRGLATQIWASYSTYCSQSHTRNTIVRRLRLRGAPMSDLVVVAVVILVLAVVARRLWKEIIASVVLAGLTGIGMTVVLIVNEVQTMAR